MTSDSQIIVCEELTLPKEELLQPTFLFWYTICRINIGNMTENQIPQWKRKSRSHAYEYVSLLKQRCSPLKFFFSCSIELLHFHLFQMCRQRISSYGIRAPRVPLQGKMEYSLQIIDLIMQHEGMDDMLIFHKDLLI